MVSLLAGTQIKWSFVGEVQEGVKVLFSVDLVWELIFVVWPSVLHSEVCTAKSGFVSLWNIEKKTFQAMKSRYWGFQEKIFVQYQFVTRHEENGGWGVGWYFGVRQGWCLQTTFPFPDYKFGVVVKAPWKVGGCVSEMLLPLLVMPCLCSALVLAIKIRFLVSALEVADPRHKIYQMSSNVNNDFNPHFLPNMLSWGGEKLMVWTLQGGWICHNGSMLRSCYTPIWHVILLSCKAL